MVHNELANAVVNQQLNKVGPPKKKEIVKHTNVQFLVFDYFVGRCWERIECSFPSFPQRRGGFRIRTRIIR